METDPSNQIFKIAIQPIEVPMKCAATGKTLLPLIITDDEPGAIHSPVGQSFTEVLAMAQEQINRIGKETKAFAFTVRQGDNKFGEINSSFGYVCKRL